jgi:hypothetical protein
VEFKYGLDAIRVVGKGPSWYTEPNTWNRVELVDVEVWGVGSVYRTHRNLDRIFILHDLRQEIIFEDRDTIDNLKATKAVVYSNVGYEGICKAFPIDKVLAHYSRHYFTNTVSWMLALAIMLHPEEITLHGIDYLNALQYVSEKACVEYWLGFAEARGIHVELQEGANLLTTEAVSGPLYGYVPLKKKDGLITEYMPDLLDGTRPQILKSYKLVPANQGRTE